MSAWAAVKAFGAVVIELCGGKRAFCFLLLAVVGWTVASSWRFRHEQAVAKHDKHLAADKAAAIASAEAAREKEYTYRVAESVARAKLESDHRAAVQDLNARLAAVRTGAVVVRQDRQCPAVRPEAGAATAGSDDPGAVYLPSTAVERVLQLGAEADAVASRLTACQSILIADREALQ